VSLIVASVFIDVGNIARAGRANVILAVDRKPGGVALVKLTLLDGSIMFAFTLFIISAFGSRDTDPV